VALDGDGRQAQRLRGSRNGAVVGQASGDVIGEHAAVSRGRNGANGRARHASMSTTQLASCVLAPFFWLTARQVARHTAVTAPRPQTCPTNLDDRLCDRPRANWRPLPADSTVVGVFFGRGRVVFAGGAATTAPMETVAPSMATPRPRRANSTVVAQRCGRAAPPAHPPWPRRASPRASATRANRAASLRLPVRRPPLRGGSW
jgi:hypothetical protein